MRVRIYIAASLTKRAAANDWKRMFAERDWPTLSTWHETATETVDPSNLHVRGVILQTNMRELRAASVVFADTTAGERKPCATYGEIGYGLALGLRVLWYQPKGEGANIWDAHPFVHIAEDHDAVMRTLDNWAREPA